MDDESRTSSVESADYVQWGMLSDQEKFIQASEL
jgi:hypothetical protein